MKKRKQPTRTLLTFGLILATVLCGQIESSRQQWANLGDYPLENGKVIQNCRIGYRIYGRDRAKSKPVIIVPTWFGGTSEHIGNLVGPGKLLDSTRYRIIALDALGNGVSSSPSNSATQPDDAFPVFTIRDMVNTQYQALTQVLRIHHVYAITGGSMGGMQTFQWIVSYPDFMEKAVPYVGAPWSSSYGRLVWKAEAAAIEEGLACGQSPEEIARQVSLIQILNAYTPEYRNRSTPASETDQFAAGYLGRFLRNFRIYDWYRQIQAMQVHDVTTTFSGSKSAAVANARAKTLIIVSRQDHLVPPGPAEEWATLSGSEIVVLDNDCGHLAPGCEMERFVRIVNDFLSKK